MPESWTDSEKMSLLNQVIVQLTGNGAHINYKELNMPGRTVKSLMHQMEKVRAQGAAHQKENGQTPTVSPKSRKTSTAGTSKAKPTTPKRAGKKRVSPPDSNEEDDEEDIKPSTPRVKRQRRAANLVKKEVDSDEDDIVAAAKQADTKALSPEDSELTDIKEDTPYDSSGVV